jgi:hypothetical protein
MADVTAVLQADKSADRIAIAPLGPHDAAEVEELFMLAERQVTPGFLARRMPGEYARLLSCDDAVVVGARRGGTLIGYSACYRIFRHPYSAVPFLAGLDPEQSVVYHGGGTVIAPGHEGRLVGRRLLLARHDELLRRGAGHFLGLIAVGNWLSLGNAVHAGGFLVGLVEDATALNYVAYAGDLARHQARSSVLSVDWDDIRAHERTFAAGLIVTGLKAHGSAGDPDRGRSRRFLFSDTSQSGFRWDGITRRE